MINTVLAASAMVLAPLTLAQGFVNTSPELGKAEGRCRANEQGPAFLVQVNGLKDRTGSLKLEVYPSNDADFLQDDNILINAGKTFRRVEVPVPAGGPVELCIRVPGPGAYSVTLLHDRDTNRKFGWTVDGIGFASNPRLGWSKPKAEKARAMAANGPTQIAIVMNYRRGLGMSPLR
jgi:hypothetical protein